MGSKQRLFLGFMLLSLIIFVKLIIKLEYFKKISDPQTVLIVDMFIFNGEPASLLRLFYLQSVVDIFLIIEFNETFTSKRKPSYLEIHQNVISGQVIAHRSYFPNNMSNPWNREIYQRNYGKKLILERMKSNPFLLIVGDADEIPNAEAVRTFSAKYYQFDTPNHLIHQFFYYSFKWTNKLLPWNSQYVVNDRYLRNMTRHQSLHSIRTRKKFKKYEILNGGWHCSYCFTVPDIARKLQSFSHTEYGGVYYTNLTRIQDCVRYGKDLFDRVNDGYILSPYDGSFGYPYCPNCTAYNIPNYEIFQLPSHLNKMSGMKASY